MNRRTAFSLAAINAFLPVGASAQTALGPVFAMSEPTTVQSRHPGVASAPDGSFVAVWQYRTPSDFENPELSENREIHARRFGPRGTPLGTEFVVNPREAGQQEEPRVAMNADGDFAVVWRSRLDGDANYAVYARRFRADGAPRGKQFRVHDNTSPSQKDGRIAIDGDGRVVVTWTKFFQFPRSTDVFARCYGVDGAPLTGEFLVGGVTTDSQHSPAIAMNDDGQFVIAWADWRSQTYDIRVQRYDSDCEAVGEPIVVAQAGPGETFYKHDPAVAMDADGDFVVSWASRYQDGDRYGVYARRYRADGVARGEEFRVNVVTSGDQRGTEVASDATGNFVVAWTSRAEDGNYPGTPAVWARRYDHRGKAAGRPFRVHPASTLLRTQPDIAMDADGEIVVAWLSGLGNGHETIDGRRFQGFGSVDLQLNQFDTPDPVQDGGALSYTLKVSNLTPASTATASEEINRAIGSATNVRVVSQLPPGSGASASGENWSCVIDGDLADCSYTRLLRAARSAPPLTIQLTAGPSLEPSIVNDARVRADQPDPRKANNRDIESTVFQN